MEKRSKYRRMWEWAVGYEAEFEMEPGVLTTGIIVEESPHWFKVMFPNKPEAILVAKARMYAIGKQVWKPSKGREVYNEQ